MEGGQSSLAIRRVDSIVELNYLIMPKTSKIGLLFAPGVLLVCCLWIFPMCFDESYSYFTLMNSLNLVSIISVSALACGVIVSPLLITGGIFYYPDDAGAKQLFVAPIIYVTFWIVACLIPFNFLLVRDGESHWATFWYAPVWLTIFTTAIAIRHIIVAKKSKVSSAGRSMNIDQGR